MKTCSVISLPSTSFDLQYNCMFLLYCYYRIKLLLAIGCKSMSLAATQTILLKRKQTNTFWRSFCLPFILRKK